LRFPIILIATLALLSIACCNASFAQETLRVAPGAEVYDHLEHFRALGLWRGSLELRPMSRAELAEAIDAVGEEAAKRELGRGDRRRLSRLEAIRRGWDLPGPADSMEGALYRVLGIPEAVWEPGAEIRFLGGPADLDSLVLTGRVPHRKGLLRLSLDAEIARRLSAQLGFYEDYSRFSRSAGEGGWVDNLPMSAGDITQEPSARLDRAILAYGLGWAELRFGREERRWGAGRRGSLFLSENPFPLDGFSFHFRTRWVSGASLFAQTRRGPQPASSADEEPDLEELVPGEAYAAMHRFELRPPGPLSIGLWEAAAYGGRGIDFGYANPVGFLVAMTQDIADQSGTDDKKVVGADFRLDLAPLTLYAELLLDRLVALDVADQSDDPAISSFAQLAGLRWANPFGLSGADLDLEYAHLDPQVYFHHDHDPRRSLTRDDRLGEGALLGHWLGPNADALHAAFRLPPAGWGRLDFELELVRWGLVDGKRGDEIGFFHLTKDEKEWITGDVVEERVLRLSWERRDWPVPAGRLDSRLTVARVDRQGPEGVAQAYLEDDGWQVELGLNWRFDGRFREK